MEYKRRFLIGTVHIHYFIVLVITKGQQMRARIFFCSFEDRLRDLETYREMSGDFVSP